jgi:hypothetical protein
VIYQKLAKITNVLIHAALVSVVTMLVVKFDHILLYVLVIKAIKVIHLLDVTQFEKKTRFPKLHVVRTPVDLIAFVEKFLTYQLVLV